MSYRYTQADVDVIDKLHEEGRSWGGIELSYAKWRREQGTATAKQDYSNKLSRLRPTSKHYKGDTSKIYVADRKLLVIEGIMLCLSCKRSKATRIYRDNILPICQRRHYSKPEFRMESIKTWSVGTKPDCKRPIRLLYTSIGESDEAILEDRSDWDDHPYTALTDIPYHEILAGLWSYEDLQDYLDTQIKHDYEAEIFDVVMRV